MSCERYAEALLEHALAEPAAPELESHLRDCAACRDALERARSLVGKIDGELQAALTVSPGPSLMPRIRAAVAEQPPRSRAWTALRLLPVAAALAAAITTLALRQPKPAVSQSSSARSSPPASSKPAPAVPPRAVEPSRSVRGSHAVLRPAPSPEQRPHVVARGKSEPEVLVPPGEEELVRRFAAALRTRRIDESSLLAGDTQARAPELSVAPLEEIPLLELKPLTSSTDPEGVDR